MRKPNLPIFAKHLYTVVSLILYTGGILAVILSGGISEGDQVTSTITDFSLIRQIFMLNYIATFLMLLRRYKKVLFRLSKDWMILVLIGIVLLSVFWSTAPQLTINRGIAFFGTTLFGIYLATYYTLKQQLQILGWTFAFIIISSLLFVILLPQYGVMRGLHNGAWRGIYTHKNNLGQTMALSTITFLLLAIDSKRRILLWGFFGLSIFLLIMSRSSSPLIFVIILCGTFLVFPMLRWKFTLRTFGVALFASLVLGLLILIATQAEVVVGLFGKDLTLTGRTNLWFHTWELIEQRPLLGYGYGALWSDWSSETAYIWRAVGWRPPSSHNGFLELWLTLGLLGVFIFLIHFSINFARAVTLATRVKSPEFFFPLFIVLFTILANITEAPLLANNNIDLVLYITSSLSCIAFRPK